jgi:hypothetical protein
VILRTDKIHAIDSPLSCRARQQLWKLVETGLSGPSQLEPLVQPSLSPPPPLFLLLSSHSNSAVLHTSMDQLAVSFDCDPPISPRTTVSVQGVHTRHASLVSASLTSTSRHTHHAGADMAPSPSASPLLGTPPLLLPRRRAALYPNILEGGHARQMSRSTPAVAHRVQVVVCASCDGFLSDKGMRVSRALPSPRFLKLTVPQ